MSAGGDICLGTQGMALLSAQIQLEDATRCRTNYPAATMVAQANCRTLSIGGNSHCEQNCTFLLLDNFIRKNNVPSQKDKRGQAL